MSVPYGTVVMPKLLHTVSTDCAFAAVTTDGSAVTWGFANYGGYSDHVREALNSGVQRIYSTDFAFAAVKADGSVITWGCERRGGNSNRVREALSSGVQRIYSSAEAFAAVKTNGSVVTITLRTVPF